MEAIVMKKLLLISMVLFFCGVAQAFDGLTYYTTVLSNKDHYSSKGTYLKKYRDVLQQDRAYYNKFHRPDAGDGSDGYFITYNKRLQFQSANIKINPSLRREIESGKTVTVTVYVYSPNSFEVTR